MSTNSKRVLITGARAPVTLHFCRLLAESGMVVYTADSIPYALTKTSNSVQEFFLYPSPKFETKQWLEILIQYIKKNKIDLLIPTCEETFYISKFKEQLSSYCEVFVDEFVKLDLLHNKYKFIRFIREIGLKAPKTYLLSETYNMSNLRTTFLTKKLVLKKVFSRFSDGVHFLNNIDELPEKMPKTSSTSWIIQEKVDGEQYCSYSIAKNGELVAHSIYRSEFTAGLGATLSFENIDNEEIEAFIRQVVKKLSFTGQISFDFIMNQDGVPIPIECNPRTTSGLHLFDEDLGLIFQNNLSKKITPKSGRKEAIKLGICIYGLSQITSPNRFRRIVQILFSFKDITFRKNDPKPFFYQFISMYQFWKESKKSNLNVISQSTIDINWDGE
ncbi:ATP-grasp domain-containing protein [Metabacillus malikii]|uniref:Glutathione synthase/RimK-type ligase-like ATP-grasp enzyme n=1 Tax=Metabacillus malikii TaxID=1504265 RepID=A0ABT9ZJW1_9BACI|nr:ATP-grasp domain-containing protein [Metabacillus malikii]MDQ0232574.1 glutathione synthase/RimK-type ligase-like ATP-grasp enzyme [Metabacillus malikii]